MNKMHSAVKRGKGGVVSGDNDDAAVVFDCSNENYKVVVSNIRVTDLENR